MQRSDRLSVSPESALLEDRLAVCSGQDAHLSPAGMLPRHRRWFAGLSFLLLAAPLVFGVVRPDSPEFVLKEGRRPARAPQVAAKLTDWLALPGRIDDYLKDHFGLRYAMIRLHKDLTRPVLLKANTAVLIGRDGRMFYLGDEMVRQSAGLVLRDQKVSDVADLLARMNAELTRRGGRLLVAVPPNSSTIYQDDLPIWAQNRGRKTEYDLLLQDLADRGVRAVDLRPAVAAALSGGNVYLTHDTHWTDRGALAAFNAIAEADGHPGWRLDPKSGLAPPSERSGGDLLRILGLDDRTTEAVEALKLPLRGRSKTLSNGETPDTVVDTDEPGPTILVLGDSFTEGYFPPMVAQRAGRVVWAHYRHCAFDWRLIETYRPDEVWWMPTERGLYCEPGARPLNFPSQNAAFR